MATTPKRTKDESENEEGDPMTDSDQSSDDSSSSSESTDSEESLELDSDELEKRREEIAFLMTKGDSNFALLRESLYQERITINTQRLEELRVGNVFEYVGPLKALREEEESRFDVLEALYKLKLRNIETRYEAEVLAITQSCENEKEYTRDFIHNELIEKIQKLEEDRNTVDISSEVWCKNLDRNKTQRNLQNYQNGTESKKRKTVTVSGPYIVYMLNEQDIVDDWAAIRRAVSASKRKSKFIKLAASPAHFPEGFAY